MISRVSNPDASSSPSVQMMAMLICFTYLAKGPKSGEYLMFSDDGEAEWYTLFRGARNIIQTSAFVKPKPQATTTPPMGQTPESIQGDTVLDPNFFDRFRRFQEFLSNAAAGEEAFEVPLHALNLLKSTMTARYGFPGNPDDDNHSGVLFSWLYRMSDEFLSTLHQKRPASLVILSFYATLLRDYRPVWVMNDWPDHIKAGVSKYLHPRYQQWVE
ncbi:Hypothetical protein D9617_18g032710 [Elsinoe fawcettii]|nr:Hypothetical protein D9617_18g032710 [Elsinoe fawcettii]